MKAFEKRFWAETGVLYGVSWVTIEIWIVHKSYVRMEKS